MSIPRPAFITSGAHLSGFRVTLGYETLAEAQDAHAALAAAPTVSPSGGQEGWQDIISLPRDFAEPFVETNGRQFSVRCEARPGALSQSSPATWGCVVRPTHWLRLPALAPASPDEQGEEGE